ncbi:probable UDP-3-O-acylglucosamine N-acyltransferase 2, mitochondrial isoform X1 [Zingiber officinale]|uniref:probable UDP-3-O-acylglucosamine N-acyltransferase 2, mitochondrial isoform X2 n=2 Tax=Zingiber officinale TaxID=94328 RepID=UPI001C4CCCD6|nr:probable UDP-3-O-acylglucosamine N-acyltransferase 2, mitochondrial isoform X2 [Zingiber officinale]XP_042428373.1 probable UDP-3-O-acylglucosamine N-acyltransferase 2, mitochondrial isoform X1 [Zingiber officinale]XP_042428374.1 probable UDP-3-O-acylglucosamine N-acyltransferase 2, mitochondrial isoform X1 [Zingiber officinale]XP_042428375.1 probable UDP-3-O-acylglucosamine N-acyltransferase 2, mitochondrial isoform X1 [Zingiber officinale]XP_042428376.1 probable UDP-3-O-acylglucosamine N-a
MKVTSKLARKAFHFLSRGRSTSIQLPSCYVNLRHISCSPSEVNKIFNDDSLEFARWKNGGGLFHQSSDIDPTAIIEIGAVVHGNCMLASDVHIRSGTVVGSSVSIGQSTKVGYKSVLTNCSVGNFSTIHNGVCVGQDGFGFFVDENGHMVKKPQELFVRIANHVEIGANTCIDRGSWRDTVIGDHTKIDNLVQIGHNVVIGKCCMLCGQVGVAGSVTIGDYVTLGGRVAIRDHVTIASKVRLAANSSVTKDITEPGDYGGFPAVRIYILYSPFSSNAKTVSAFASHLLFRCLSASGVDNLLDCVAPASNLLSRASTR